MELPVSLDKSFHIPSGKTLKLEVRQSSPLSDAVLDAKHYLETAQCPYTRVEFKYDKCYIVIARLQS